jgi:hypothetical protein
MDLFPEMIGTVGPDWDTARKVLRGSEAKVLCGDRLMAL